MKIIISGGLGYVGGRLSDFFVKAGHQVIALSRKANALDNSILPVGLTVQHPDAVTTDELKSTDVFIHLAALNEIDSVKFPAQAISVNVTQTVNWLDKCLLAGVKSFVFFSTAHVYGKPLQGFYTEASTATPVHPYAITHRCAEDYVLAYALEKGMNNLVIRLTNSFGGPAFPTADRWTLLVNDLCRSAVLKGEMQLLSDGLQLRDFVCLHDVCKAVDHLLGLGANQHGNRIYNLGAGYSTTVYAMAKRVQTRAELFLKRTVELTRKEPAALKNDDTLTLSIDKLKSTGFTVTDNIDAEIDSTLAYFKTYSQ
jgi:UDP-glucose 4-epimerase